MIRIRSTVPALAAAGAVVLALSAVPAAAQGNDAAFRATTFNLSASGETAIAPDMATITLGVQTEGASAAAALSANGTAMNKVIAALKKAGVAERDIQTSNLNVNPQYVYEQNQPPRLTGYQASNQVTILARDLSKLGQTVDAAASAGANTVSGISFGLQNPQKAEDEARIKAVAALKAKSDLYARATGYKVVRLVSLNEAGGYTPSPQPVPMFAMAKREMADSTAISGGELKVRVEVSATYEAQQ
ncbi:SIMPL domain-containing protein [Caulobacter sp. CCNWLY153]|uniref:SIMPL domain-containing protein n=1 Tax=Caulobacter radicis TaxID=2172650 RepID=A0A2T9J7C1_9CAUL|nr:SIMPL domain-containing protein [Caulobacter radicis]PVM77448.1 hypothetical protein DDF65_16060 [Caulobacter radicis]